MSRVITVGAAQLGPIQKADSRGIVVERMLALMHQAHAKGCELVVFPELALTTFFPRWVMEDQAEVDGWFESAMPGNETQPHFTSAADPEGRQSQTAMPRRRIAASTSMV